MTSETLPALPAEGARSRAYVRFGLVVMRAILARVASGETVAGICRDPLMPSKNTVKKWADERPEFARRLAAARRAAGKLAFTGRSGGYCPVTAQEVFLRLADGESMKSICSDPQMPSDTTVARWRQMEAGFDEAIRLAREIQAERITDMSWELAEAATPETAYLTQVRLGHLRWLAAIHGPRTYSRAKPREAPVEPKRLHIKMRRFEIETREDGWKRMVCYVADPGTTGVEVDHVGEWYEAPEPAVPGPLTRRESGVGGPGGSDGDEWV